MYGYTKHIIQLQDIEIKRGQMLIEMNEIIRDLLQRVAEVEKDMAHQKKIPAAQRD